MMNHQSALDKEMMLKLLFGADPMKRTKMTIIYGVGKGPREMAVVIS